MIIITYIRVGVGVGDDSWRFAHEAKAGEVALLVLDLLILLWAEGVITGEVEVTQSSTRSGHDLLELLLLLVIVLVLGVVLVGVSILAGGVDLFHLGQSAMKWVMSPHSKQPLGDLLLSLQNLCKVRNFLASRAISLLRMLSYCSSKTRVKEDKANSKADETVVLGLASWPPTRALIIKALLEKEASWLWWFF
jgi:hypothetical protein